MVVLVADAEHQHVAAGEGLPRAADSPPKRAATRRGMASLMAQARSTRGVSALYALGQSVCALRKRGVG